MRTIWLVAVSVLLTAGVTAPGQQPRKPKPNSCKGTWAIQQVRSGEDPPLIADQAPPGSAPVATIPAPSPGPFPSATSNHWYDSGPGITASPCPKSCETKSTIMKRQHHGHSIAARLGLWACYRPARGCPKYPCGPCHRIPVHYYFCGCREGYKFCALPPCCPCHKPDLWGKIYAAGHRMFGMPTGHGIGGSIK